MGCRRALALEAEPWLECQSDQGPQVKVACLEGDGGPSVAKRG